MYSRDVFPGIWGGLDKLVEEERLIAPREVRDELKRMDDIKLWTGERQGKMFLDLDQQQIDMAREIGRIPGFVKPDKITPDADPYVIALALARQKSGGAEPLYEQDKHIVVTQEVPSGAGGKPKIPNVCHAYGLECISLIELFRREGWTFVLSEKPRTG
jgi:hypothetical protein